MGARKGRESDPEKHPGQWNGASLAVGVARLSRNSGSGQHRNPSQGTWPPAQAGMALIGNLLQVSGGVPLSKAILYFQPLSMLRSSSGIQWLGHPIPHISGHGGWRGRACPPPAALQSILAWAGLQALLLGFSSLTTQDPLPHFPFLLQFLPTVGADSPHPAR